MAATHPTIDTLPSEVLMHVLELFPTRDVLPLAGVCQRFHSLVARLHYARLVEALALHDHEIILECYHPTVKISTPYLFCDYVGTPGLAAQAATGSSDPTLAGLSALYSRFRPIQQEDDRRPRSRYPKRAVVEGLEQPALDLPSHDVYLDAGELFSQLVTVTNLVKVEPTRRLIIDAVNMTDGVIRVFRKWLASEAAAPTPTPAQGQRGNVGEKGGSTSSTMVDADSAILWADPKQNCGLRMRVVEKVDDQAGPVLVAADDEPAVSYKLEFEELLIRTNQLLLNVEKSKEQVVHTAGKALVIVSA